jgi:subtilisin family serine protease
MDLLAARDRERAEAGGVPEAEALADRPILVEVVFDGDVETIIDAGFELRSFIPGYAAGDFTPSEVRALSELDAVRSIRLPGRCEPSLDKSVPQIKAPAAWNLGQALRKQGKGVIIGVIDNGIDVRHDAFRNINGTTRLLRLWDQTFKIPRVPRYFQDLGTALDRRGNIITELPTDETGARATPDHSPKALGPAFDYGLEFKEAQINKALSTPPSDFWPFPVSLSGQDPDHGTQITGIAAGKAAISIYSGVAPEAWLIFVRTDFDDAKIVDAGQYIVAAAKQVAPGAPVVINCSFGNHIGPHNGYLPAARAFDELMRTNENVLVVLSAGNERDDNVHAAAILPVGDPPEVISLRVIKQPESITIFGSYNSGAYLLCRVIPPYPEDIVSQSGDWHISELAGATDSSKVDKRHRVYLSKYARLPGDPDGHFKIRIERKGGVPTGTWQLEVASEALVDGNLHLWIDEAEGAEFVPSSSVTTNLGVSMQDISIRNLSKAIKRPDLWIRGTVSAVGTCERGVMVGAYNAESKFLAISDFSSQGPSPRDLSLGLFNATSSLAKPDIAAPGESIDAPTPPTWQYLKMNIPSYAAGNGTSLAAPHITGVIALMWAQKPHLKNSKIKDILRKKANAALTDWRLPKWKTGAAGNPNVEQELWGAGMVDAEEAVKETLNQP